MRFSTKYLMLIATVAMLLNTGGCDRRTPEERLRTAFDFYQQGDQLSAEMEALKVVEKAPDDPAAVQANLMLAQIYTSQKRFDEAEMQLQSALANVSQRDELGKAVLRQYLTLLNGEKKFDESLDTIAKYQKEYSDDPGTSLSLIVAKANVQTMAGKTTAARTVLNDLIDKTTAPAELSLYRDMYMRTYIQDQNSTAAIAYIEKNLPTMKSDDDIRSAQIGLASLYGAQGDYANSRRYLKLATDSIMDTVRTELDNNAKLGMVINLGQVYMTLGNLPGSRRVFQALYESGITDPRVVVTTVGGLSENLLRLGETSATESLLADANKKFPKAKFDEQLDRLRQMAASGELQKLAPEDTSTLTLKYRADPNILWPQDLPQVLGDMNTSATVSGISATSGTATITPDNLASGTAMTTSPNL